MSRRRRSVKKREKDLRKYVGMGYLFLAGIIIGVFLFSYINPPQLQEPLLVMGFTLTAFSIMFGFFITILGNPRIQIGRFPAIMIWVATMLLLLSVFGNYLSVFYGFDFVVVSGLTNVLPASLLLLAIILMTWGIIGAYKEERKSAR